MELNMQLANVVSANEQQRLRSRAVFHNYNMWSVQKVWRMCAISDYL